VVVNVSEIDSLKHTAKAVSKLGLKSKKEISSNPRIDVQGRNASFKEVPSIGSDYGTAHNWHEFVLHFLISSDEQRKKCGCFTL